MKKALAAAALVLIAIFFIPWPEKPVTFHGITMKAPWGWTASGFEDDYVVKPREGLWGRGLVKVRSHACSYKSLDELKATLEATRNTLSQFEVRSIHGHEWVLTASVTENPIIYQAITKAKDGSCMTLMGDPESVVTTLAEQISEHL